MTEGAIYKKIVRRGITLVFLGLVYNGLLSFEFDHLRCASVLARIGLGWMFAALLFVRFGWKVRAGITVLILVGYWLAMAFVPVPDAGGAGPFTLEGNLVGYIDRLFLPGRLHETVFDPEGLFSTVPAIVLLIVGLLWSLVFPINKKLWTSSFVCVVGAYSVWMFALFFYIIDVLGWRKWTLFFTVIGMNSITIYLAQRFIRFSYTSRLYSEGWRN